MTLNRAGPSIRATSRQEGPNASSDGRRDRLDVRRSPSRPGDGARAAAREHRWSRPGLVGRRDARRHRRGGESRLDRAGAERRDRWRGSLFDHRSSSRHLHRHVHAARLQNRQARRHRAGGRICGAGERRAGGRHPRGDGDRHRRVAGRRHAEHAESGRPQPTGAGRAARRADHAGRREPRARRQLLQSRVHQQHEHPRLAARGPAHLLRRHEHRPEPDAERPAGQRRRRQRARTAGARLRRRIAVRRKCARRCADGFDPERGREHLRRHPARVRRHRIAAERQHHRRAEAVYLGRQQHRLHLRRQCRRGRTDPAEPTVVPFRAARVSDEQPDFTAHGVLPAGRHLGVGRAGGAALDGSPDMAGERAKQDRLGVLQIAGRHQEIRRGVHGDQLQQRVVHFARSGVLAADAAAIRVADQMDLADHQPPAPRDWSVAGRAHVQIQLPAGKRSSRHPAFQLVDERAHRRVRDRPAGLLQPDLEHRGECVLRDRLPQHEDRGEPAVGVRNHESGAPRRHFRVDLRESERCRDAEHGQPDEFTVQAP